MRVMVLSYGRRVGGAQSHVDLLEGGLKWVEGRAEAWIGMILELYQEAWRDWWSGRSPYL